jgi:DNA ligase-1
VKRVALALDATRATRSRTGKEQALAHALASIANDPDDGDGLALATAARMAASQMTPVGVGWSLMLEVMVAATGWDEEVVRACTRKTGDMGEAFGLLVARIDGAESRTGMPLREVAGLFLALAASGSRAAKRRRLDEVFARATPIETKYLAKAILGGLRVGAQAGVLEGAMARAFALDLEEIRRAGALVTDPGELAVLARDRRLSEARVEIGRPVAYMLATPIETIASAIDPAVHVCEDKIDGVRAQVHRLGNDVSIFARGLERVTDAFPEVVDAFRFAQGNVALDGELVAVTEDLRPRPFQALQARLQRKSPSAEDLAKTPVAFIAYDYLADEEGDHLALPWTERRAKLEGYARTRGPRARFAVNPARSLRTDAPLVEQLDVEFEAARARGHEGVVLKRIDGPYEAGRRGQAWIKVKRAFATLDVVVTAAEEGHGRRAGVLSDYTFGVWRRIGSGEEGGEGERELVNVGKAYSGLTDGEIEALTKRFEKLTVGRYGGVRAVRPEIVLEVAFDGVQRSTRHKSGFALRFPRIVRIREDKRPEDADRLETVDALFRSQIETGHREEGEPAKKRTRAGKKPSVPSAQLSLFGEPDRSTRRK